ncbi:hypothetical protein AQ505_08640 [Pedobacter sp. PACM 27299]|uniref:helix-turn-helix domain-containing protein n=1 Tax=Pedobacter sp. PACM 27299 TaxID=1727164 RepID=UPI0007056B09|nr:helix-turn-helix transcriptional regulator [Pedobacter sp. PACM 27299]ALL05550.1 hypothetical protein AQ505_08640 [Pedobacter sp. PACM 27299]
MDPTGKEKIAKLIKEARLRKGYSQQQLADLAQLNLRSVQRMEKAEVLPRAYSLNLLATHLDLDIEVFEEIKSNIAAVPGASPTGNNQLDKKSTKIILSTTLVLLTVLLTAAFLSQSSGFPETSFELFLFLALIVAMNGFLFWRIWKDN